MSKLRRYLATATMVFLLACSVYADGEMGIGKDGTPPPPSSSSPTTQPSTVSDAPLVDAVLAAALAALQSIPQV